MKAWGPGSVRRPNCPVEPSGPVLVVDVRDRMNASRTAEVRSVWELPDKLRPVPVVVLVDEIAEPYLSDGTRRVTTKPPPSDAGTAASFLCGLG